MKNCNEGVLAGAMARKKMNNAKLTPQSHSLEPKSPAALALERGAMSSPQRMEEPYASTASGVVGHCALGVSCALRILMQEYQGARGRPPPVLNERRYPLCDVFAPTASFDWVQADPRGGVHHDLDVPPLIAVSRTLARHLAPVGRSPIRNLFARLLVPPPPPCSFGILYPCWPRA